MDVSDVTRPESRALRNSTNSTARASYFFKIICFQVFQVFQVCAETLSRMAVGLQIVGLFLGVVSWCLQSSCTSNQVWKMRSQSESVTTSQWQFEGLWMSCAATSLGSIQCSKFKTVLGLSGENSCFVIISSYYGVMMMAQSEHRKRSTARTIIFHSLMRALVLEKNSSLFLPESWDRNKRGHISYL